MVSVRTVAEGDWELMRDVRLAALRDVPDAFGSSHAREELFTEEQWRGRINARSVTFFAYVTGSSEPAGCTSATGSPRPGKPSRCRPTWR
jgi:hypothetical protein